MHTQIGINGFGRIGRDQKHVLYLYKHSVGCRSPPSVLVFLSKKTKTEG